MRDFGEFLDELVSDSEKLIKSQLVELVKNSKSDNEKIIQKMGKLTEEYVQQRAAGELSNSEFKELIEDVIELDEMQYHKLTVQAKVSVDKVRDSLKDIVLNKLMVLI